MFPPPRLRELEERFYRLLLGTEAARWPRAAKNLSPLEGEPA